MKTLSLLIISLLFFSCASRFRKYSNKEYEAMKFDPNKIDNYVVSQEMHSKEYMSKFIKEVCGSKDSLECGKKFLKAREARLKERYFAADIKFVVNYCNARPIKCKDPVYIERAFIESHNENIKSFRDRDVAQADARNKAAWSTFNNQLQENQKQEDLRKYRQEQLNLLRKPSQTKCNSRSDGTGGINTNCTSY